MGEAKLRRLRQTPTVYHHTSTLRTNLLWMAGVINLEGQSGDALHPVLGTLQTNTRLRRDMKDFPALAWFTSRLDVPKSLLVSEVYLPDRNGGYRRRRLSVDETNAYMMHRVALGFRIADIDVTPWPEHAGYATAEGEELNESAREYGDDPDDWYVSETPVDLMRMSEIWAAKSIFDLRCSAMTGICATLSEWWRCAGITRGSISHPHGLVRMRGAL